MKIIIYNKGEQLTLDNNSPMADRGKIGFGFGSIRNGICIDGQWTKKEASDTLEQLIKTFLDPKKKKVI